MWYAFLRFWTRVVFTVALKLRVIGRGNVPERGGVILASNHQSYMDPPLAGVALDRPIHFMARKSLFTHNFLFTRLIRSLNAFPVERGRGDIGAVREMMRRLKAGGVVLAFPESTRTYTGEIGPFKHGVFLIAGRSGVPVVPMVIEGAFEAWPRSNILPRPRQIVVAYGKPLSPADFGGDDRKMADACREAMLMLQGQARELRQRSRK